MQFLLVEEDDMKIFGPGVRTWSSMLGAMTVALLFCSPAFSQLNLGRIFGAVTDQSGGAIVGATVTVVDVARGVSRPLVSDGAGEYDAASLTPGTYTVQRSRISGPLRHGSPVAARLLAITPGKRAILNCQKIPVTRLFCCR